MSDHPTITVDKLRIGLYVELDLKWFEHPFAFNGFRIRSEDQIRTIRSLGLKVVRFDPSRSETPPVRTASSPVEATPSSIATPQEEPTRLLHNDVSRSEPAPQPAAPPPLESSASAVAAEAEMAPAPDEASSRSETAPAASPPEELPPSFIAAQPELARAIQAKRALVERIRQQRDAAAQVARAFVDTANTVRDIEKNLSANPHETVRKAENLIGRIVESILTVPELTIHVMGRTHGTEEMYFHSLNVATLSLMMAHSIRLSQELIGSLGMAALFHDVGRREIPGKILLKKEPLTAAERKLYELHCQYGVEIGRRLKFNAATLDVIGEHHELHDGSGYPEKLSGEAISPLARIVVIANYYDELCNPVNIADAMTPHEALSLMFTRLRGKFDPQLLQVFIRCLGVYPPGTIVQLANGAIAMVATVNTTQPMKPTIIVYDPEIPKEEAILVDMAVETDTNIVRAIRPGQVPRQAYNYLCPRQQVSYYFDTQRPGQEHQPR